MMPGKLIFFASTCILLSVTVHSSSTKSRMSGSPTRNMNRAGELPDRDQDDPCAPCGDIDFSGGNDVNECNSELLAAESFADCLDICETIANGRGASQRRGSRSVVAGVSESCRCLCKSLKLANLCPEDSCNGPFQQIRCQNNSENQLQSPGAQRCFERVFENEDTYNECLASGSTTGNQLLPTSMLESLDLDPTRGVEQCNCVCNYVDRQSEESPTVSSTEGMNETCSSYSDCTLESTKGRRISRRLSSNGNSFDDCASNCRHQFRLGQERSRNSDRSRSSGSRRSRSRSSHRSNAVSAEDCDCYCSMFHDTCNSMEVTQETPDDEMEIPIASSTRTRTSGTRDITVKSQSESESDTDHSI